MVERVETAEVPQLCADAAAERPCGPRVEVDIGGGLALGVHGDERGERREGTVDTAIVDDANAPKARQAQL